MWTDIQGERQPVCIRHRPVVIALSREVNVRACWLTAALLKCSKMLVTRHSTAPPWLHCVSATSSGQRIRHKPHAILTA